MASVNKCIIVGNLGADPEVKYLASGDAAVNLSIATTDKWRDKQSGEQREATEWHRVSFFGKIAEVCGQYLQKGSQIYVEGSLRTRKWTDKDGVEKYTTEIRGDSMQMLDRRQDGGGNQQRGNTQQGGGNRGRDDGYEPAPPKNKPKPSFDDLGDDVPF